MKLHEVAVAAVAVGSDTSVRTWALLVAGVFVLFSLSLSTFLLFDHLSTYNDPEVRICSYGIFVLSVQLYCCPVVWGLRQPCYRVCSKLLHVLSWKLL
jgi:hypothetical protein